MNVNEIIRNSSLTSVEGISLADFNLFTSILSSVAPRCATYTDLNAAMAADYYSWLNAGRPRMAALADQVAYWACCQAQ